MLWIVSRENRQFPAPDLTTLQNWARAGNVRPEDQIWHPLKAAWLVAAETAEVVPFLVHPSTASAAVARSTALSARSRELIGPRAAAYLIDLLPALVISVVGVVPLVGQLIAGLLLGCYWLLRDITGASLGKLLLGLRVSRDDGTQSTVGARIGRNIPLTLGPFLVAIPLIGYIIGPPVALISLVVEVILLMTQGSRLGDKIARTAVMRR